MPGPRICRPAGDRQVYLEAHRIKTRNPCQCGIQCVLWPRDTGTVPGKGRGWAGVPGSLGQKLFSSRCKMMSVLDVGFGPGWLWCQSPFYTWFQPLWPT